MKERQLKEDAEGRDGEQQSGLQAGWAELKPPELSLSLSLLINPPTPLCLTRMAVLRKQR